MDPKILAAIITASVSLVVAVIGIGAARRNQRDLERLKADLSEQTAARNARLEYEFEARKRLYHDCGPLLFQLSEFAERALGRITGLARTAADGDLDPGRSWLEPQRYYSLSTYYRLIAPLSAGKLLQNRLTHLDLSLDPSIHWQYALVKQIADTFTDDFDLAGKEDGAIPIDEDDRLDYHPHADNAGRLSQTDPAAYWQQGVPRGILENAISALVVKEPDGASRVMDFSEFQDARGGIGDNAAVRPAFERISYLFEQFHPRGRPVLWRILVAQAHLYQALLNARVSGLIDPDPWDALWRADRVPDFDWRSETEQGQIAAEVVATAVGIGAAYARQTMAPTLAKLAAV